ncbi:MAG TPA: hypothetical protein VFT81_00510 [Dermatophilaceae bacterium]|nr:hypothetical protein [Dermatophilaceae bacterium]
MIRRHPIKTLVVALTVLVAALAFAYVQRPAYDIPPTQAPEPGDSLVVIGVGGISWDDVSPEDTPVLWGLLRDGSAASVSVKAMNLTACPTDGWSTLSAGEAAGPVLDEDRPECTGLPAVAGDAKSGLAVEGFAEIAATSKQGPHKARLGNLGDSLALGKTCAQAIGPGAALATATSDGAVAFYSPFQVTTLVKDLAQCPVALVDVGAILQTDPDRAQHEDRLNAIEQRVNQVIDAAPNGADIMVVGLADRDRSERLRILTATGPHYAPGILSSASTRMDGVAQLSDVTATILARSGVEPLQPIGGRALAVNPSPNNSESTAADKLTQLTDLDTKADAMHRIVAPFLVIWLGGTAVILLALGLVWQRAGSRGSGATRSGALRLVRITGLLSAGMPAATFLANLIPWWRTTQGTWLLVAILFVIVAAITVVLALVSLKGPWSSSALGPLAAMSALTAGVIGLDLMSGSHLQMSSIFGLQPLVGGRFYGMGNVAFALYAASVILLSAAMAHALSRRGAGRLAALAVVSFGGIALAVDVLPAWGADFGGPIALVPALGVLLLWTMDARISIRNVALLGILAFVVVSVAAWFDWNRREDERTHLGRFVQEVLDGEAADIIIRKFLQNVELIAAQPVLLGVGLIGIGICIAIVMRPGILGTAPFKRLVDEAPLLRRGLQAVLVMGTIGFVTNDSGGAIPPVAAIFTVPLVVAAVMHFMAIEQRRKPVRRRRDRHRL